MNDSVYVCARMRAFWLAPSRYHNCITTAPLYHLYLYLYRLSTRVTRTIATATTAAAAAAATTDVDESPYNVLGVL